MEAAEECVGVGGVVLAGSREVGVLPPVQQRDGQLAEGGEDLRGGTGVGGVGILAEDHVSQPMCTIFNPPMALPEAEELGGAGPLGVQGGDGIDGLVGEDFAGALVRVTTSLIYPVEYETPAGIVCSADSNCPGWAGRARAGREAIASVARPFRPARQ